jgi:L-alanine-DL-glutamate epimerase-like enolase superfamily enzyme
VGLYDRIAGLRVEIDGYEVERRELAVSTGFTRVTTTILLRGRGERGEGEDVTYAAEEHDGFPIELPLAGTWTYADASAALEAFDLPDYRRWAFESAVLDLALRQAGLSLGDAVGREYRPVRFVVSTRGDVHAWLAAIPSLELKLDAEEDWDEATIERLAATERVCVVDLKSFYSGTTVDLRPDPALYARVARGFPEAVIEDPALDEASRAALAGAEDRFSFDAPVHSLADLDALPVSPRWLNVKPSRFGTVARLLECIEACEERGIRMYGGGQFELGVGRSQIQALASLFYADGPNDVAPSAYNEGEPRSGLPVSPLPPPVRVGL